MPTTVEAQDSNIQPARRGEGVAVTVTTTGFTYDLRGIAWNGNAFLAQFHGYVFLDLYNDGANPIYFRFQSTNDNDIDPAIVQGAGATLAAANTVAAVMPANSMRSVRLQLDKDTFLSLRSTGGNSVFRMFPSSNSMMRGQ